MAGGASSRSVPEKSSLLKKQKLIKRNETDPQKKTKNKVSMASRKKVLLKVIILGDSGYVSLSPPVVFFFFYFAL